MSQRDSGYERKERDQYETPEWVTVAVHPHLTYHGVWEPAAGGGQMVRALVKLGCSVVGTDIADGYDFLVAAAMPDGSRSVVTNPPYTHALEFIQHALRLTQDVDGEVAMLLRTDYDHAAGRRRFFQHCAQFRRKVVLTKRIRWFADSNGSPSFNHAWLLWSWKHVGEPAIAYAP